MNLNGATNNEILEQLGISSVPDFFVAIDEMMDFGEEDEKFRKLFLTDAESVQACMKYTKETHGVAAVEKYAVKHFAWLIKCHQFYMKDTYEGWDYVFAEGREDLCKLCEHCHILDGTAQTFCDCSEYNEQYSCAYDLSNKDNSKKYAAYMRVFKSTETTASKDYPRLLIGIFRSLTGTPEPNTIEEMEAESQRIDKFFDIQNQISKYCVEAGWSKERISKLWKAGEFIIKNALEPLANNKDMKEEDIIFALEVVTKSAQGLLRFQDIMGDSDDKYGILGTDGPNADER